jgi:hypothetical protein
MRAYHKEQAGSSGSYLSSHHPRYLGGTDRRIAVQEQPQAKMGDSARHQQLIPVILATQEADIRRITVGSQPRQIDCENLFQKTYLIKGLVQWLKV